MQKIRDDAEGTSADLWSWRILRYYSVFVLADMRFLNYEIAAALTNGNGFEQELELTRCNSVRWYVEEAKV